MLASIAEFMNQIVSLCVMSAKSGFVMAVVTLLAVI